MSNNSYHNSFWQGYNASQQEPEHQPMAKNPYSLHSGYIDDDGYSQEQLHAAWQNGYNTSENDLSLTNN